MIGTNYTGTGYGNSYANTGANFTNLSTTWWKSLPPADPLYVDPDSGKAAGRLGAVTKAQWLDYQTRFVPIENQLMQQTTYDNPSLAGQEIGKAETDTSGTYDNIAGSQAIQLGRYGMNLSPDQQASSDRLNSLGRTGAVVDAANNIRLKLVERNQTIASGTTNPALVK